MSDLVLFPAHEARKRGSGMSEASLTTVEASDLAQNEEVIERGLHTFVEVGQALADVRDRRLYRVHGTFEEYLRDRWEMSDGRARQLIGAALVAEALTVTTVTVPTSERVARELAPLRSDPDRMAEAWSAARRAPDAPVVKPWTEQTDALLQTAANEGSGDAARALTASRDARILLRFDGALREVLSTVESRDNLLDAITRTSRERAEDRADLCARMADFITRIGAANARHATPNLRRVQ